MSSLVHRLISDIISNQRLQQPQQQQQISTTEVPSSHLDSNNNTGCTYPVEETKQKSDKDGSTTSSLKPSGSGEKYSLRPRSLQKRTEYEESEHTGVSSTRSSRRGVSSSGSSGRAKQKPPPLSKYRRKTANARERDRMREINAAFETLRRAVPHISQSAHHSQHENNSGEKLTKITTLRLAMKYIAALSQALQQADALVPDSSSSSSLHLMSDGESLTFSEHCLTPPDLTSPDFRLSLTPSNIPRVPLPDHSQHRVPPLENRRHCLNTADLSRRSLSSSPLSSHSQKCIITSNQNILPSTDLRNPLPTASGLCVSTSSQNLPSANLGRHCLLTPGIEQASSNPSLCITTPVMGRTCLQPPELNQHCLTTVDFEETPAGDPSALLVFDDDSLESPDLDHLLIS